MKTNTDFKVLTYYNVNLSLENNGIVHVIMCDIAANDAIWSSNSEEDFISEMLEDEWIEAREEHHSIEFMVLKIGKVLSEHFHEEVY